MIKVHISTNLLKKIPDFHIGVLAYYDITVSDSPQMLRGRFDYFQEELALRMENKTIADISGLAEWRKVFKTLGIDPSRYRPSAEALYRRLKKGNKLPVIQSAADLNNYISLKHEIPLGIYDLDQIMAPIEIRMGHEEDEYVGINGRTMNMAGKLLSADEKGAFGSPIVDSKRAMTTEKTRNALHLVYLKPSTNKNEAEKILAEIAASFEQIHGGTSESVIIPQKKHP
ncbi:MAG TPA: phenylalanine--tRNA ligase beta subunit-related protein [Bacillales bacterium]|nr:phenylalanine--tRNA ligase beta subunit-related protein [Bacillales bacterium]